MITPFPSRRPTRRHRTFARRLLLEPLEDRRLLSVVPFDTDPPGIGGGPVEVDPSNTPPELFDVPTEDTIPEMEVYSFTAAASDVDLPEQSLTFSLKGEPEGASIDPDMGVFTWTPTEAQGPDQYTFWVQVSDGVEFAEQEITLHVTEVNRPPVLAGIGDWDVDELTTLEFTVGATDDDLPANPLTYSAGGLPEGASFDPDTQQFSWTPSEEQGPGSYDITFHVSDGQASDSEDTITITITVNEVNTPPVLAAIGDQEVDELSTLVFSITATDADLPANDLTYTASDLPEGASFDPKTQEFSWTPGEDQAPGGYEVTFRVSDGEADDWETILIEVARVNRPPSVELSDTVDTLPEDADITERLRVADIAIVDDGLGENTLSLSGQDAAFFEIDAGVLYLKAGVVLDYETQAVLEVAVEVDDPTVGSTPDDTATLVILVTDVNLRPTGLGLSGTTIAENQPPGTLIGLLTTTDPEPPAEAFEYALVTGTGDWDNASFSIVGDRLETGEPFNFEIKSNYAIRLRTTDAGGLWYEEAFTITVTDVNDPPYLTGPLVDQTVYVGVALAYSLPEGVFADEDFGDVLTLSASASDGSSLPSWLTFDGVTFSGTPSSADIGAIEVRVTATDSGSPPLQAEGVFSVTVSPHPRPWQNPSNPLDVNGDGQVTALDALEIINFMNGNGGGSLPPGPDGGPPFVDVNGDNLLTPLDVLTIINYLNGDPSSDPSAEGEWQGAGELPTGGLPAESARGLAALPTASAAVRSLPVVQSAQWRLDPRQTASRPPQTPMPRPGRAAFSSQVDTPLGWDDLLTELATDVAAAHSIGIV